MKGGGWIVAFAEGFGQLTKPLFGVAGAAVAAVMLNSFVLTTLDTATRINRYILEEISLSWRFIQRPHQQTQKDSTESKKWSGGATTINLYTSTAIVVGLSLLLAIGNWSLIWPVFGAANQQVAALALITVSLVLLNMGKSAWITIYPAIFMLATTIGALIYQGIGFFKASNWLLGIISLILLFLALFVCIEATNVAKRRKIA
jgi:carbon starvation protein